MFTSKTYTLSMSLVIEDLLLLYNQLSFIM